MDHDALSAGVEPGGLVNRTQIRLLVCYILKSIEQPVSKLMIQELFHFEGLANFFEVGEAVADLLQDGHIKIVDEKEDTYTATDSGKDIAHTLKTNLPFTVREKAYKSTLKMLTRLRREKENKIEIKKNDNGYTISCTVIENNRELMTIRLLVADEHQAKAIKHVFLEDPSRVYNGVIELMTNDYTLFPPDSLNDGI